MYEEHLRESDYYGNKAQMTSYKGKHSLAAYKNISRGKRVAAKGKWLQVVEAISSDKQGIFLSGSAGTGKTTFIEYLGTEEGQKSFPFARHYVILAPTGIAALRAGGTTIHSFLRFPPEAYDYRSNSFVGGKIVEESRNGYKKMLFDKLELLIIDEVSMVRADLMDAIDRSFRANCKVFDQPFGGVKVLFVGDLFQLPPVVGSDHQQFLQDLYPESQGMYFFSIECRSRNARTGSSQILRIGDTL